MEMAEAAAAAAAAALRALGASHCGGAAVFATGTSQLAMLNILTALPQVPWEQVVGFHLDEYVGISPDHPASFRRYLKTHLASRVPMQAFHYLAGDTADPATECRRYAETLQQQPPRLCLLGVGENGHLAFNDPDEANFEDPQEVRTVALDRACRMQQVNEGHFARLEDVPAQALTLTIPAIMRIPELIVSVPGRRKAAAMKRALTEPISPACPATILRQHLRATAYLDAEAAAELPHSIYKGGRTV